MGRTEIIPATPEHCALIAADVRPADKAEIWAAALQTPAAALRMGMMSGAAMTGLIDNVPVCVFGVVRESLIGNVGTPWLVGSARLDAVARPFLRDTRARVMDLLAGYDRLENHVDARNTRSITWLRWLGFTIDDPQPYGALGLPFHRFWMSREVLNV